ncbi:MAG: CorA family divalent cation transporter [Bilophila wadsworthia]
MHALAPRHALRGRARKAPGHPGRTEPPRQECAPAGDPAFELLQHCQFVLQQQTDQRLRQLTVLSAIFMPLTLITGVYGMNFAYMPETGWRYGYYATLAGMVWLAIFLWITLKRKGWFR